MPDPISELVQRGRALSPEDRERLVDSLLESLNEPSVAEMDASWEAEIERRLKEIDEGRVQLVDAENLFARTRRLAG